VVRGLLIRLKGAGYRELQHLSFDKGHTTLRQIAGLCSAPIESGFDPLLSRFEPRSLVFFMPGSASEIDNAVTPLCRANQTSCAVDVSGSITAKARGTGRKFFNDFSHACELGTQPSGMAPRATV
jgi:hypothetical protein